MLNSLLPPQHVGQPSAAFKARHPPLVINKIFKSAEGPREPCRAGDPDALPPPTAWNMNCGLPAAITPRRPWASPDCLCPTGGLTTHLICLLSRAETPSLTHISIRLKLWETKYTFKKKNIQSNRCIFCFCFPETRFYVKAVKEKTAFLLSCLHRIRFHCTNCSANYQWSYINSDSSVAKSCGTVFQCC